MSPKAKLKALLEAHLVLRDLALEEVGNPIFNYRCHEASMEVGKLRRELQSQYDNKRSCC